MLNSTTWLYGAEILPIALRSKIMGLAAASHFIVNVASKFAFTDLISVRRCFPRLPSIISTVNDYNIATS